MSGPVQPPLTVETIDGATVGRPITKIKVTNGTLAVSGSTATLTISGGGGGSGTVTSVGLTETGSALTITGSPVTTSGTFNIAGAGTSSQVILGDLSLGTLTSGTVTGTGTSGQVSYWNGTSSQTGSANLTFDGTNLKVGGYTEVGTKITTPTGTDLTLDTVGGTNSGSIVIADGVDGQVSISANGAGAIKLGAANNPVTVSNVYTLPTVVTTDNNFVLTAQTDGSTAWAASGGGGGVTFPLEGSDGTTAAPTYSFSSDTNTGIYRPTADAIGFTVGGNERMRIANNAVEGITFRVDGTDTAAAPGFSFDPDNDTGMFSVSANTLSFSTGGSERLRIGSSGEILIAGTAAGTSGQVLTSGGSGAAITWSDAGGGNEFNAELVGVELDASGVGYDVFDILSAPPYGVARYTTGSVDAKQYFYPFIAPATGDLSELIVNITSAAGSATNLYYGFYRDNNGVPSTVLGYATVDATSTGNISVTSFSGTISLTRGNQFWVSQNKSTSQSITQRSIQNDYLPRIAPSSSFPSTTNGYSASLASNASVTAVPADVTAEGLEGGVYFAGLGAKPHIGVKIT